MCVICIYFRYGFILKYFGFNFFYLNINFNMLCCLVDLFMEERNFVELFISIVRIIEYCIFELSIGFYWIYEN